MQCISEETEGNVENCLVDWSPASDPNNRPSICQVTNLQFFCTSSLFQAMAESGSSVLMKYHRTYFENAPNYHKLTNFPICCLCKNNVT